MLKHPGATRACMKCSVATSKHCSTLLCSKRVKLLRGCCTDCVGGDNGEAATLGQDVGRQRRPPTQRQGQVRTHQSRVSATGNPVCHVENHVTSRHPPTGDAGHNFQS